MFDSRKSQAEAFLWQNVNRIYCKAKQSQTKEKNKKKLLKLADLQPCVIVLVAWRIDKRVCDRASANIHKNDWKWFRAIMRKLNLKARAKYYSIPFSRWQTIKLNSREKKNVSLSSSPPQRLQRIEQKNNWIQVLPCSAKTPLDSYRLNWHQHLRYEFAGEIEVWKWIELILITSADVDETRQSTFRF